MGLINLLCLFLLLILLFSIEIKTSSYNISNHHTHVSLYRKDSCTNPLTLSSMKYFKEMEGLLSPPFVISKWKFNETLSKFYLNNAHSILKKWIFNGIKINNIRESFPCDHHKDEPIFIQFIDKELYIGYTKYRPEKRFIDGWIGKHQRRLYAVNAIYEIVKSHNDIKDFEISLCVGDKPKQDLDIISLNVVASSDSSSIPLSEMEIDFKSYNIWNNTYYDILKWRNKYSWNERINKAVFRGRTASCYPNNGDEIASTNQSKIIENLIKNKELDCGRLYLNHIANNCEKNKDIFDVGLGFRHRVPMSLQEKYKLVIYAEGNYGWSNRLKYLLGMKNVIIMQFNNGGYESYSSGLIPWVHYIPVDHLFTSITSVVHWALNKSNEQNLLQISENADEYFKTFLSSESMKLRLYILLREFSKLFKYKIIKNKDNHLWTKLIEKRNYTLEEINFRKTVFRLHKSNNYHGLFL